MNLGEQGGTQGGDLWARLIHPWTNFQKQDGLLTSVTLRVGSTARHVVWSSYKTMLTDRWG